MPASVLAAPPDEASTPAWGIVQNSGRFVPSFPRPMRMLTSALQDDTFVAHVMGGITWALDSGATKATNHSANVGAGVERSAAVPKSSIYSMGFLSLLCTSLFIAVYHL